MQNSLTVNYGKQSRNLKLRQTAEVHLVNIIWFNLIHSIIIMKRVTKASTTAHTQTHTHLHTLRFNGHFSSPGLAGCPLNYPSPFIPELNTPRDRSKLFMSSSTQFHQVPLGRPFCPTSHATERRTQSPPSLRPTCPNHPNPLPRPPNWPAPTARAPQVSHPIQPNPQHPSNHTHPSTTHTQPALHSHMPGGPTATHQTMSVCLTSVAYIGPKSRTEA